jgi:hypothetical protein
MAFWRRGEQFSEERTVSWWPTWGQNTRDVHPARSVEAVVMTKQHAKLAYSAGLRGRCQRIHPHRGKR